MSKLEKWELLEETDISPSKWFPLFVHKVKLPNRKIIDDYYISKLGDVAMVVAITENKEIVFVRQYKHGVDEITLELPAGMLDDYEPEAGARKELEEETGIVAEDFLFLGKLLKSPSKDPSVDHGFLVINAKITKEQSLDESEDIEIVLIPINEIDEKIKNGEIIAVDTIAYLYLAKLKFPKILNYEN